MATLESRVSRLEDAFENVATKDDLAGIEERMATKDDLERFATKEDLADLEKRMASKDDLADLEKRMASKEDLKALATKNEVEQLRIDIGPLKAAHVRNETIIEAPFIAGDMGFRLERILESQEKMELSNGQDVSDISRDDLRSFQRADLIMRVTSPEGQEAYIAVEISYTVDERDTTRAIRNATYIARFTGRPARAAVAGLRRDRRIENMDTAEVFWYELPASIVEVE